MFSWSGSAALGGILVSFDGLLFNFSVTATMQFLATIPVIALMLAIPVDNLHDNDSEQESSNNDDPRQTTTILGQQGNTGSNP